LCDGKKTSLQGRQSQGGVIVLAGKKIRDHKHLLKKPSQARASCALVHAGGWNGEFSQSRRRAVGKTWVREVEPQWARGGGWTEFFKSDCGDGAFVGGVRGGRGREGVAGGCSSLETVRLKRRRRVADRGGKESSARVWCAGKKQRYP